MPEHRSVALFGGIYSNLLALAASIKDSKPRGVEALYGLADSGGFGPDPYTGLRLLQADRKSAGE